MNIYPSVYKGKIKEIPFLPPQVTLTLKTYVPSDWKIVLVKQQTKEQYVQPKHDSKGIYVLYQSVPHGGSVELSKNK